MEGVEEELKGWIKRIKGKTKQGMESTGNAVKVIQKTPVMLR